MTNYGEFSDIIEDMFDWNVMGTLSDGVQVFYVDDREKEKEEKTEMEMREGNEDHVNVDENLLIEEIIVEEEEVIEMSGVSFYEGCYDLGMKFLEEGFEGNDPQIFQTFLIYKTKCFKS